MDDLKQMAREAGAAAFYPKAQAGREDSYLVGRQFLERFAQLVAQQAVEAEREACAKVCQEWGEASGVHLAATIRARASDKTSE